jgi:rubrerythrin
MKPEDFKKIINLAIDREVESYTFYRTLSDKVKDAALKKMFTELSGEETKHREYLQGLLTKGPQAFHVEEKKDYKIAEMLQSPPLSPTLKPVEGIVLAIRKELDAMQMYTRLAGVAADPEEKKMFLELAKMEKGHKARLEDLYTNMAFPEVW